MPGCILEFGVQWGAGLPQLISLRGIYEPYNYSRHIYGFDTFEGFVNTSEKKMANIYLTVIIPFTKAMKVSLKNFEFT